MLFLNVFFFLLNNSLNNKIVYSSLLIIIILIIFITIKQFLKGKNEISWNLFVIFIIFKEIDKLFRNLFLVILFFKIFIRFFEFNLVFKIYVNLASVF